MFFYKRQPKIYGARNVGGCARLFPMISNGHPNIQRSQNAGFTLIEVMMVMVILVAVMSVGAPMLFTTQSAMRSAVRELATRTREIRNIGRLYGSTMRLVINMDDEKGHSYWVESATGSVTLMSDEQKKEFEKMTSVQREKEAPKKEFEMDSRVMKKPQKLPKGFFFESVEFAGRETKTTGQAMIHFFPAGISENVAIHFTDRKRFEWTIAINPLTGRADVYERKLTLKDLESK
jgi:general secretion pathway protein H